MENPTPPIASPQGAPGVPAVVDSPKNWKTAPVVIRGWAWQIAALSAAFWALVFFGILGADAPIPNKIGGAIFAALIIGANVWLLKAFKTRQKAAWNLQIVLSILGLFGFPLGTLIHGYILSQWFKPQTKAWFS